MIKYEMKDILRKIRMNNDAYEIKKLSFSDLVAPCPFVANLNLSCIMQQLWVIICVLCLFAVFFTPCSSGKMLRNLVSSVSAMGLHATIKRE